MTPPATPPAMPPLTPPTTVASFGSRCIGPDCAPAVADRAGVRSATMTRDEYRMRLMSIVSTRFLYRCLWVRRAGTALAIPELVAHHTNFEEERRRIDPPADLFQIRRADPRRAVHDFEQAAFEVIEHRGHRLLACLDGILAIETAGGQQIVGPALRGRDVAAIRRVHDVPQHALGSIEVIGNRGQENPLTSLRAIAVGGGVCR